MRCCLLRRQAHEPALALGATDATGLLYQGLLRLLSAYDSLGIHRNLASEVMSLKRSRVGVVKREIPEGIAIIDCEEVRNDRGIDKTTGTDRSGPFHWRHCSAG